MVSVVSASPGNFSDVENTCLLAAKDVGPNTTYSVSSSIEKCRSTLSAFQAPSEFGGNSFGGLTSAARHRKRLTDYTNNVAYAKKVPFQATGLMGSKGTARYTLGARWRIEGLSPAAFV